MNKEEVKELLAFGTEFKEEIEMWKILTRILERNKIPPSKFMSSLPFVIGGILVSNDTVDADKFLEVFIKVTRLAIKFIRMSNTLEEDSLEGEQLREMVKEIISEGIKGDEQ